MVVNRLNQHHIHTHRAGKAPAPANAGKAAEDAKEFGEILDELRETIEATKEEIRRESAAPGSLSAM